MPTELLPLPPLMATRPRQLLRLKGEAQMLARHRPPRLPRTRSDPFPGLLGRLESREGPRGRVTWGSPPAPQPSTTDQTPWATAGDGLGAGHLMPFIQFLRSVPPDNPFKYSEHFPWVF